MRVMLLHKVTAVEHATRFADALPWAERYIATAGEVELDLRPLYDPAELRG